MTSRSTFSSLARILSSVAFLVPLALPAACFDDQHTVGTDPDDAGTSGDASSSGQSACKAAGGSCVLGGVACATEAPTSAQDCNPDLNPGGAFCCLSASEEVDAGSDDCAGQVEACNEPVVPEGCTTDDGGCIDGVYVCPSVICPDAGSASGSSFECGKAFCNSSTEYCSVVQGGAIEPDGGANFGDTTCEAIPTSCADDHAGAAATCACIASQVHGTCASSNGGDLTVDIDVP